MSGAGRNNTGLFDDQTFERSILPAHLKREVRDVIEIAVMCGWQMHISSANAVTLVAPEGRRKYHFGVNSRASNNLNKIKKDIFKFGDPEKVLMLDSLMGIKKPDPETVALVANSLPHIGDEGTVVDYRPELERERAEQEREAQQRRAKIAAENSKPKPKPKPPSRSEVSTGNSDAHIIREGPMIAKGGDEHGYDSRAVIERKWSDGSIDYKCAKCEYTSPNRQSVPAHYASAHRTGEGTKPLPPRYRVAVPNATQYAPRQARVDALAQVIAGLIESGETNPEKIAREALVWVKTQTREGSNLSEDAEPKTPEETLNRIRTLLDDGSRARDRQQIAELEAELIAAEEARQEAQATAERVQENLRTFRELVTEMET